ncbi:hypothetical protein [Brevundimonas viscosa]|uniref:Uncharacterized protein n=1 Tax=Brevundimonas viscosa TaxID=871741 RepID=A0A1I6QEK0_9CAUL|nr:hypothetical protein [Brevundimonas viscosa]SFS50864.1 hypothetical protein SAMN05192570_1747 [Brevundimonas viscosa]
MLAAVIAVLLQQASPAAADEVVWSEPQSAAPVVAEAPPPPIPDSARTDPYGYERAQCSPLIRSAGETLEACQARVRTVLAAHLGEALPAGLAPGPATDACRQEAEGDRYGLQCGAPSRSGRASAVLDERICETRPRAQPGGGVVWEEQCRPASRRDERDEGLTIRWGERD